jgi:hypothetical protein
MQEPVEPEDEEDEPEEHASDGGESGCELHDDDLLVAITLRTGRLAV